MYKHHQSVEEYQCDIKKALYNDEQCLLEETIQRSELDYIPDCDSGIEDNPYLRIPELSDLEYIMSQEFKNYVVQKILKTQ